MKAIKIEAANIAAIAAALAEINGKSIQHTFSAEEILAVANRAEKSLEELGIAKSNRKGALLVATSGSPVAKCYKSGRNANMATLSRTATGWVLTDAVMETIWPSQGGERQLYLTEQQRDLAITATTKKFKVK